jgi:hypothetical protein
MKVQSELSGESAFLIGVSEPAEHHFSDVEVFTFTGAQAEMLEASEICATFDATQAIAAKRFANGELSLLIFEGMLDPIGCDTPVELPNLGVLQSDFHCLKLASRSQILINIVEHRAFAFDLDSNELVRLVGNFKGGGKTSSRKSLRQERWNCPRIQVWR